MSSMIFIIVIQIIIIIIIISVIFKHYIKCPSDKVLVIFGKVGASSVICKHGGAAFVMPIIQSHAFLDLMPYNIDIELKGALTRENIRVNVSSVFTVGISTQQRVMENAAERLLGLTRKQIVILAQEVILGQLRLVLATMDIDEIHTQSDRFLVAVQENVEQELNKIGLRVINININSIRDEAGYLEAITKESEAVARNNAKLDTVDHLNAEQQKKLFHELIEKNPSLLDEIDRPATESAPAKTPIEPEKPEAPSDNTAATIAKKLKARGMLSSDIAEITGLSELDILSL
ncbi:MAG: flotillin family protein [Proteobacteria bacterium]|nr:flotillin family protein [Pseudomonadota bacterium]